MEVGRTSSREGKDSDPTTSGDQLCRTYYHPLGPGVKAGPVRLPEEMPRGEKSQERETAAEPMGPVDGADVIYHWWALETNRSQ